MEKPAPVLKALRFGLFELRFQAGRELPQIRASKSNSKSYPLQVLIALLSQARQVLSTREELRHEAFGCLDPR